MPIQFILLTTAVLLGLLVFFYWLNRRRFARLLAAVQVVSVEDVASQFLEKSRTLYVYLPPGYSEQGERYYRVLYLNDGQDREQLNLHETLARLYARRVIEPIIVVAIPTGAARLQEYGTAAAPNAQGLGKKAGQYTRFLIEEVMPLVDKQFRTRPGAAILGASLGGLSAFDIAWNHPDLFEKVGVFSGSFWWRAAEDETHIAAGQLITHQLVRQSQQQPDLRFWLEAATRDETSDRDNNGVIDAIQDTLELIDELVELGYREGDEVVYVEVEGGRHNYETWSKILSDFLIWAFPGRG
jgi:enterochelin esterase-like enzyme